jgi:hypothetical protein
MGAEVTDRLRYVEGRVGGEIPPALLRVGILGHRLIVAIDPAEETTEGGIIIPQTRADAERSGSGYIVKVGDSAGLGNSYGTANYEPWFDQETCALTKSAYNIRMEELVGRHIAYGQFAGRTLRLGPSDRSHLTSYEMIHCKDVLFFHNDEDGFVINEE